MPKLNGALPKYRKHRASGQAVVTLNRRDHYLGPHGTQASKRQYDRLIAEYLSSGRSSSFGASQHDLTVVELAADYLLDRDALWAYEQLDVITATPDAAPSLGAWGLLKWARGNRNRFFEQVLPKVAASKKKRDEERKRSFVDDDGVVEDRSLEELRMMIHKRLLLERERFIADSPKAIEQKVRSTLGDLTQRAGLAPSADAMIELIHSIVKMTGHCVEAALARPEEYKRNNANFRERIMR